MGGGNKTSPRAAGVPNLWAISLQLFPLNLPIFKKCLIVFLIKKFSAPLARAFFYFLLPFILSQLFAVTWWKVSLVSQNAVDPYCPPVYACSNSLFPGALPSVLWGSQHFMPRVWEQLYFCLPILPPLLFLSPPKWWQWPLCFVSKSYYSKDL